MARSKLVALAGLMTLLAGLPAAAGGAEPVAAIGGPAFTHVVGARLTGAAEVDGSGTPNQGDLDGVGMVNIVVEQGSSAAGHPGTGSDACLRLIVSGIDTPTAAHIHKAPAGSNGPIVVTFPVPAGGTSSGCVAVPDIALQDDIALNPSAYYVNVHTTAFPNGALRGQLAEVGSPLTASLSGAAVLGTTGTGYNGDADALGQAEVLVDPTGMVCVTVTVSGLASPTAVEVHAAPFTANGPAVVSFPLLAIPGSFSDCRSTTAAVATTLAADPTGHSVEVRTAAFPGGAVRGQLSYGLTSEHAVDAEGRLWRYGDAVDVGSTAGIALSQPIVGMAATPTGHGYWLVASDGGIFSFGDAAFFGSTGGIVLNQPIVGMAAAPTGRGYWLVASDGGVFRFGDAGFFGSTGGIVLNQPIVGMAATPTGHGYWLVASDGGIFSFGDAAFFGSTGAIALAQPIVGMAATPTGLGYWLAAADGGVFTFGDATFLGSAAPFFFADDPFVSISALPVGQGYRLTTINGQVSTFGEGASLGSVEFGFLPLAVPIVGTT